MSLHEHEESFCQWADTQTQQVKSSDEAPPASKAVIALRQIKPLSYTLFGGEGAIEYNALRSALRTAAEDYGHTGEHAEREWLEKVPRTSMVVELVNALHRHGFKITSVSDGGGEHASRVQ